MGADAAPEFQKILSPARAGVVLAGVREATDEILSEAGDPADLYESYGAKYPEISRINCVRSEA